MNLLLKDLLVDPLHAAASFAESLDLETYALVFENVDPQKSYPIKAEGKAFWTFVGETGVVHFIRIMLGAKETYQVKLGFFDKGKPVYDKPNLYFGDDVYRYDEKVLNTYVKVLTEILIPYFFSVEPDNVLEFPATDKARYRLYKLMAGKFLDQAEYEVVNDDGAKRFSIKKKL
jgi:hypothetical protein